MNTTKKVGIVAAATLSTFTCKYFLGGGAIDEAAFGALFVFVVSAWYLRD